MRTVNCDSAEAVGITSSLHLNTHSAPILQYGSLRYLRLQHPLPAVCPSSRLLFYSRCLLYCTYCVLRYRTQFSPPKINLQPSATTRHPATLHCAATFYCTYCMSTGRWTQKAAQNKNVGPLAPWPLGFFPWLCGLPVQQPNTPFPFHCIGLVLRN